MDKEKVSGHSNIDWGGDCSDDEKYEISKWVNIGAFTAGVITRAKIFPANGPWSTRCPSTLRSFAYNCGGYHQWRGRSWYRCVQVNHPDHQYRFTSHPAAAHQFTPVPATTLPLMMSTAAVGETSGSGSVEGDPVPRPIFSSEILSSFYITQLGLEVPPADDIASLHEVLCVDRVLALEWRCLGRRPLTPKGAVKHQQQESIMPTMMDRMEINKNDDFDFDLDDLPSTQPKLPVRRREGELKGGARKKTASFDGVINNMKRFWKLDNETQPSPQSQPPA